MRPPEELQPVHYAIYVYEPGTAPPADPVETTLCPWSRKSRDHRTRDLALVTCDRCRHHIDEIGLAPGV